MTDAVHEYHHARMNAAEADAKIAEARGQIHGIFTGTLSADPLHAEQLRAKAWARHDPSLVLTMKEGKISGVPDGWPPSVPDPAEHVAADIAARRDAHIEKLFGRTVETETRQIEDSPSVRRLREVMAK